MIEHTIKIHKDIIEHPLWKSPDSAQLLKIYLYLLMEAAYEDCTINHERVLRNQIVNSIYILGDDCGVSGNRFAEYLKELQKYNLVQTEYTRHRVRITVNTNTSIFFRDIKTNGASI